MKSWKCYSPTRITGSGSTNRTRDTRHELPPDAKRIPIALWSRLRYDLAPYLAEHAAPGGNVLNFYTVRSAATSASGS